MKTRDPAHVRRESSTQGVGTNGNVSFWFAAHGLPERRAALSTSIRADVCIVGAGLTGLWTAYYLKKAAPSWRVVVLEREFAGYGASGRNGGWLTNSIAGNPGALARRHGTDAVAALQHVMDASVDETIAVAAAEGIEADIVKGGTLQVATTPAQLKRLHVEVENHRALGLGDFLMLDEAEAAERIRVDGMLGAYWNPQSARVQPAKLVTGLARVVESLGVEIYESTPVSQIATGAALTPAGSVRAPFVIRATEGFTAEIPGLRRAWLPMNSSMVVTAPLPAEAWEEIGWRSFDTLGDEAHVFTYSQRTADGRIAIGGRGVPYRFGSRTDNDGTTHRKTIELLRESLHRYFPATRGVAIDHAWSGVLGVPRDWTATVGMDHRTGLGWAGGYVGHGVTTTNLAGRTLRDLVLERNTAEVQLLWVSHQAPRWEPEPLRWIGVRSLYAAYTLADRRESDGRPGTSRLAKVADRISGRE